MNNVEIYHRILKYPIALPKRRPGAMKIVHHINGGTAVYQAAEVVTPEDLEKIYAVIVIAQQKTSRKIVIKEHESVRVITLMYEVSKLIRNNNYKHIIESIKRCASLTISYSDMKKGFVVHILNDAAWNEETGEITVSFPRWFYEKCIQEGLTLNFDTYSELSPTGKNLYSFLISNSSDIFKEETLIERSVIQASRSDKARAILVSALNELVNNSVIRGWSKEKKNREWLYTINRATSTAGGKLLPQQVENRPPKNPANQPP